jgi:glycosyltransferase involved in cell wall biosynthesis
VITTNDSRAQVLSKRYGRREITVLANVPLLEAHPSAKDPGYPRGKRVILFLGRISADGRAFRESIKALRLLDDDVVLVILGFGWESERDRIRAWAQEEGVADRVELLPPLPFEELAGAAASATVGLVPLYKALLNHTLGDTNKLHEYLMGGLPVVASGLPEIRRVVESGDPPVGELFDPLSPESIAQAIRAVIDDPRYPERRVQARKMAIERFNWTIEERKLLSLYERLTENGSIGAAATLERA